MKRFYNTVTLNHTTSGHYQLLLDGKPVQTPAKQPFFMYTQTIADKVVAEWECQHTDIVPETMPVSQMAMTLIDRVEPQRTHLQNELLGYINTDLLCYRAQEPEIYKHAQMEAWDPFIDWFEGFSGLSIKTTDGLSPVIQPKNVHDYIQSFLDNLSDAQFMAAYLTTLGTGSILLSLCFISKQHSIDSIVEAAFVEERLKDKIYLENTYGIAPDQMKRYQALKHDLETLTSFI